MKQSNTENKYVLITGVRGGMGRAAAKTLAAEGYSVIGLDVTECDPISGVTSLTADCTSEESLTEAYKRVSEITDKLYAIIHFAGLYMLDSLVEMSEEKMKKIYDVNLFGVMRINRIFLPLLSTGSRIVITTSELAPLDPLPFTGIYALTKSALDKYAYSLRMELQLLGISVTVMRPGAVSTPMIGKSVDELDRFIEKTKLYSCNAQRFRNIVNRVEARSVSADRIGELASRILRARRPRLVYSLNRNPLLLLLNILPDRFATFIIKCVLK